MKIPRKAGVALAALVATLALPHLYAQHGHLNVGAVGKNQNDALSPVNGPDFAASSGYVKALTYGTSGRYAGYYQGGITFTALPTFDAVQNLTIAGPAPGSFIKAAIVSVDGPAGSHFLYWPGEQNTSSTPLLSLASGYRGISVSWDVSDASAGAGSSGGDAFGHLHGNRFGVDQVGDYTVGFRFFDASVNGVDGGRIHAPSDVLLIRFQGTPEPSIWALAALGAGILAWRLRSRG